MTLVVVGASIALDERRTVMKLRRLIGQRGDRQQVLDLLGAGALA